MKVITMCGYNTGRFHRKGHHMIRNEIARSNYDHDGIGEVVLYQYFVTLPDAVAPFWFVCGEGCDTVLGEMEVNLGHFDTEDDARAVFHDLTSEEN